jgi:hypothetical protein
MGFPSVGIFLWKLRQAKNELDGGIELCRNQRVQPWIWASEYKKSWVCFTNSLPSLVLHQTNPLEE